MSFLLFIGHTEIIYEGHFFNEVVQKHIAQQIAGIILNELVQHIVHVLRLCLERGVFGIVVFTVLVQCGGKLPDNLFKTFAELSVEKGYRFFATFGTTETSARLAFLPPKDAVSHIGSIGHAIPEGRLTLVDDNGNEIEGADVEGELRYEGPNVTMGYGTCIDDLQKGDEFCGVYMTGDLARRDKDGYYYIVGRKKRFLKLFGLRVSLDQSEKIISDNFGGIECACTGDDNQMLIYITQEELKEEVKKLISEKTNLMTKFFDVRVIESMPRFESGKINYKALGQ